MKDAHVRTAADELVGVDLNLVVAFDALAREQSVTRAAHRLGVTQSAVSHALRRLRDLLGDPLLVRGKGGMVLTPRAQSLVVPVRTGLVTLQRALAQPGPFDPATARRAFTIASPDLFDVLVLPPLLERVRADAPGIDLAVVAGEERRLPERLETGELDLAVMPRIEDDEPRPPDPTGLVRRTLLHDDFTCFLRADHPTLAGPRRRRRSLKLDAWVELSHALVSPTGEGLGLVDRALATHGRTRRIALRVPNFYSALVIVAHSDLALTAPTPLGRLARGLPEIVALAPPLPLPRHALDLVWHERFAKDPGHLWLRNLVANVVRTELG